MSAVAYNLARLLVFVCAYREKPDSDKYCDDAALEQWAKRGERKARSHDIAAAARPIGEKTYQQFLPKAVMYSS